MPFCRECGKEVQEDWVSCPYCSQSIVPPESNKIGLQDSVVMGDVSISENSQTCHICNSQGVTISACIECKSLSFCNVCEDSVDSEREDRCGEYWYDGEVNFKAPICNQCFDSVIANSCDIVCENCDVCIVQKGEGTQYCHTCSEHLSRQQDYVDLAKTYNDWADESDDREKAKKERRTAKEYQAIADKESRQFKARTSKKKISKKKSSKRDAENVIGVKTISLDGEEDTVWNHEMDDGNLREHLLKAKEFWVVDLRQKRTEFVQWNTGLFEYWCDDEMVREIEPLNREEAIQTLQVEYLNTMLNRKE